MLVGCVAAAIAILAYATSASAQPISGGMQNYDSQTPRATPEVAIIDINALPTAIQSEVNAMIARSSKQDMQALKNSIDATPQASAALKARGLKSEEVVAALVDDEGSLTLITNEEI
jgi:hypothetical protein